MAAARQREAAHGCRKGGTTLKAAWSGLHPRSRLFATGLPVPPQDSRSRRKGLSIAPHREKHRTANRLRKRPKRLFGFDGTAGEDPRCLAGSAAPGFFGLSPAGLPPLKCYLINFYSPFLSIIVIHSGKSPSCGSRLRRRPIVAAGNSASGRIQPLGSPRYILPYCRFPCRAQNLSRQVERSSNLSRGCLHLPIVAGQ
jgi:hypothetical protein